jgi:malate/lactate dehydrogenase
VNHGHVEGQGRKFALKEAVDDNLWLEEDYIQTVQQRGLAVIKARQGKGSAASAANAIVDHVHDWLIGTPQVRNT